MAAPVTLRDHARHAVRDEVSRRAWSLFADQGFEATTVDQIAAAAGMSRRTFFRYFDGKDELLLDRLLESGGELAGALQQRPADEPAWPALRAALDVLVRRQERHAARARVMLVMLREPAVRASLLERQRRWQLMLAPLLAPRLPAAADPATDPRPTAVAGCAIACLDAAQDAWLARPGARLGDLLDEAMSAVAPLHPEDGSHCDVR
jgi:AcrR family transcriptional regulator